MRVTALRKNALRGGFQALSLRSAARAPAACSRLYSSHTGSHTDLAKKNESLEEEMERVASRSQTSVSLKATLDTGLGLLLRDEDDTSGMDTR